MAHFHYPPLWGRISALIILLRAHSERPGSRRSAARVAIIKGIERMPPRIRYWNTSRSRVARVLSHVSPLMES